MNKTNTSIIVIALLIVSSFANTCLYAAQEQTILERVRIVEDPELAKLIQIAIDNLPESRRLRKGGYSEEQEYQLKYELDVAKLKAVRIVTEKYSQIKLLDKKIEQIEKKFGITKSSPDISLEIEIAKATLESTRMTYIAELREGLGMIPWYPFGPKEHHELKTWLHLELLGDGTTIRILNFYKQFNSNIYLNRSRNNTLCSSAQAVQHIKELVKQSNVLPIKITFAEMETASDKTDDFINEIKRTLQNAKADYATQLSMNRFVIKGRTVFESTDLVRRVRHPGQSAMVPWSVDKLASDVKSLLKKPSSLPLTIEYTNYDTNPEKGIEIETAMKNMIEELNLKDWITIKNVTPPPTPE